MADLSVRIRGLTKRKSLLEAKAKGTVDAVRKVMEKHAASTVRKMQNNYNTVPISPNYKRTFNLKNLWEYPGNPPGLTSITADGIVVRIQNDVTEVIGSHRPYAVKIHGDESGNGQVPFQGKRGWKLIKDVVREGYQEKIRAAVHEALS